MWLRTSDDEVRGDQKKMEAGCGQWPGQGHGMGSGHGRRSCAQNLRRSSRNNRSSSESDSRSFTSHESQLSTVQSFTLASPAQPSTLACNIAESPPGLVAGRRMRWQRPGLAVVNVGRRGARGNSCRGRGNSHVGSPLPNLQPSAQP